MKHYPFLFLFLILLLSSCSFYRVDSENTSEEYWPPKNSLKDVIYLEKIDRPHKVIGIVKVNAERRQSIEDVIEKMKYEAAILGGDAITDIRENATGTWKKLPAQKILGNAYIRAEFSATVVLWEQE